MSTAKRIRDSKQTTVGAIGTVLIVQILVLLWFSRSVDVQYPFAGVVGMWCVGAAVWIRYTTAHLFAPIADIRTHPQRVVGTNSDNQHLYVSRYAPEQNQSGTWCHWIRHCTLWYPYLSHTRSTIARTADYRRSPCIGSRDAEPRKYAPRRSNHDRFRVTPSISCAENSHSEGDREHRQ